ncbi:MAG TPA: cellulose biosynthesis cyclic di-GMP-binding regulatory protein BcsB [Verrucomicrobiae bacterium]
MATLPPAAPPATPPAPSAPPKPTAAPIAASKPSPQAGLLEQVRVDLIGSEAVEFPGTLTGKNFFIRLPEHVRFRAGSEVLLMLQASPDLLPHVCAVQVSVNGEQISSESGVVKPAEKSTLRLRLAVPERNLSAGWNRISLQFQLKTEQAVNPPAENTSLWTMQKSDNYLTICYDRLPLFPELQRFPHSLAEERLLHVETAAPTVVTLLPAQRRNVHLRACAVLGARLGQAGYLSEQDCRVALIVDWQKETEGRNAILVGRRDELGSVTIPYHINEKLGSLRAGEGLLAEWITGKYPNQRRCVLVTGSDDSGVEKAVLTLGSSPALASAPPNPAIIAKEPALTPAVEADAQPSPRSAQAFTKLPLQFRGIFRHELAASGWRLPPGFKLASGSALDLQLSHSPALVEKTSTLEVRINGTSIGRVLLTSKNAGPGSVKFPLPKDLPGHDPMQVTFHAYLDAGKAGCDERGDAPPLLTITPDSKAEVTVLPRPMEGLDQVDEFLLRDSLLRKAALLVPADASAAELQVLADVSFHLGRNLPSSPVLWPEACAYSQTILPPKNRLASRSVLLLGSAEQWQSALPPDTRLAVRIAEGRSDSVLMQGRKLTASSFEPSLVFLQMLSSPWSGDETLVVAGGWHEFATPTLKRILTDDATTAPLSGNICVMDSAGRAATYDLHLAFQESLAERIQRKIPLGHSMEETKLVLSDQDVRARRNRHSNIILFYVCSGLLLLVVSSRAFFLWERVRQRSALRSEEQLSQP